MTEELAERRATHWGDLPPTTCEVWHVFLWLAVRIGAATDTGEEEE